MTAIPDVASITGPAELDIEFLYQCRLTNAMHVIFVSSADKQNLHLQTFIRMGSLACILNLDKKSVSNIAIFRPIVVYYYNYNG